METIKITYVGYLSQVLGRKGEEVSVAAGATVSDLLGQLGQKHGEAFNSLVFIENGRLLEPWTRVLLDEKDIRELESLETKLRPGIEVCIMGLFEIPAGG